MAFRGVIPNRSIPTAFEQLMNEISYHRTREIQQYSREESGFILLNPTTFWTDLFVRHFLCSSTNDKVRDDLLFFVRKHQKKTSARYIPQFETAIEVFRKDSKRLPIGDPDIDWEETVYLNLILQQFEYTLTCAVCTRTSHKDFQVLRRNSQRVYASPSRRSMDCKGETEEISYPNIFFTVDNYDEVFGDIIVHDGEMVCIELVAADQEGTLQGVIFSRSIHYEAVKRVYEAKMSLSTRFAQKVSMGLYQGQQRMEFVRMRGPDGVGHAGMAVTRDKNSGVETPSSEPGYSLTDYDWEEPEESPYIQRRMSDPSSNLNNFVRSWKSGQNIRKSQSENEGVDYYSNGVCEIEAGDLRDATKSFSESSLHCPGFKSNRSPRHAKKNPRLKDVGLIDKNICLMNAKLMHKKQVNSNKEIDDTTYNRLWAMPGFDQAFHFWKEYRRANSPALHAYLTYITLPWYQIITDLTDLKDKPALTF